MPPRDSRGRFTKRKRRNLDGSFYGGKFHPYRDTRGYDEAKAGDEASRLPALRKQAAKRGLTVRHVPESQYQGRGYKYVVRRKEARGSGSYGHGWYTKNLKQLKQAIRGM